MFNYNSSLQNNPPVDSAARETALGAVRRQSPYGVFGQNHQDVLGALGERAAATLNTEARRANAEYSLQQQQAQRQLALDGLNQMAQAQQNQSSLANSRLGNMVGFANNLLGGLFN